MTTTTRLFQVCCFVGLALAGIISEDAVLPRDSQVGDVELSISLKDTKSRNKTAP